MQLKKQQFVRRDDLFTTPGVICQSNAPGRGLVECLVRVCGLQEKVDLFAAPGDIR